MGAHGVDHVDRVRVRLTEYGQRDAAVFVVPGGDLVVGDGIDDLGDFVQVNGRAIAPGHHDVIEILGLGHVARGLEGQVLVDAAEPADGRRGVGGDDRVLDVVEGQAARVGGVRIGVDAHGEFLLAEHQHLRDARQLRDRRGEDFLGVIIHRGQWQGRGTQNQNENRRVGWIDLAKAGRRGQLRRQATQRRRDHRLHVEGGAVDVAIKIELHRDVRTAIGRTRGHQVDAGNLREGALERRDNGCRHGLRVGAGQLRCDGNRREVDARQRRQRQFHVAENAEHDERHHQQCRHHRAANTEFGKRHQMPSFFA